MPKQKQTPVDLQKTFLKVQGIVAKQLKMPAKRVQPTSHLQQDLGADSLDALEITMSIEEAFHLQIPEEVARSAKTIQEVVNFVHENRKG